MTRDAPDLTAEEWEVLELMRGGLATKQIAEQLCVPTETVKLHIGAILTKLRVSNRREALRLLDPEMN